MTRYYGNEDTISRSQVVRYLTQNFADEKGNFLPEDLAMQLVVKHTDIVERGITLRSHSSYVGDQILENARDEADEYNWVEADDDEEDEDD